MKKNNPKIRTELQKENNFVCVKPTSIWIYYCYDREKITIF